MELEAKLISNYSGELSIVLYVPPELADSFVSRFYLDDSGIGIAEMKNFANTPVEDKVLNAIPEGYRHDVQRGRTFIVVVRGHRYMSDRNQDLLLKVCLEKKRLIGEGKSLFDAEHSSWLEVGKHEDKYEVYDLIKKRENQYHGLLGRILYTISKSFKHQFSI